MSRRKEIRRLLLAAEAGQKADIQAYSSGHLGPQGLIQNLPEIEIKQPIWGASQSQEQTPTPLTARQTQTKALTYSKKIELTESEVWRSKDDQATDQSSLPDRKEDEVLHCPPEPSPVQPRNVAGQKSDSSSDPEGKPRQSDQEGLNNNKGQFEPKQQLGKQVASKQDPWAGVHVMAEGHFSKLQLELRKLPAQSWPSRERLAVFSDVFDDVCEGLPVFGRILREIKTDYDLYFNHIMDSQSSLEDMRSSKTVDDLSNIKESEMELEEAQTEVSWLEQEARNALEENKRVRDELENLKGACLSGPRDSQVPRVLPPEVESKRQQVLDMWSEIQQLEEETKEQLVPTVTTTAIEGHIKDLRREIIRLIASNERLKTTNKDLENNIDAALNTAKASKAIRRMLWEEIQCDRQTRE